MYRRYMKRGLDVVAALILLLILLPLLFLIVLISCCVHRGRVLFRQERVGRQGTSFRMLKFRTMNERRNPEGALLPDPERTTRFGDFLRRYSLDELPQLIHVISGKMSLVGPRPLLREHVADCTPEEFLRHQIRPGVTGLAQIRGRNRIPFQSRFRYDLWYIARVSFSRDVFILYRTVGLVFRQERI